MPEDIGDIIPHMTDELWSALCSLREKVDKIRVIVSEFEPRDGRYLLDRTVLGYLDGARVQGEMFAEAVTAGIVEDARIPPRRYIIETVVDLYYLLTEPDPQRAAARIVVWDLRSFQRVLREGQRAGEVFSGEKVDDQKTRDTAPALVEIVADELADVDERKLLREVFDERRDRRRAYHWSGKGRFEERLRSLEGRLQRRDPEMAEGIKVLFSSDWRIGSAGVHPRPRWSRFVRQALDEDGTEDLGHESLIVETKIIAGGLGLAREAATDLLRHLPLER